MSYTVDGDGKVTFRCQGKDCGKTKDSRSLKVLPKGWCVTGILLNQADAEVGEEAEKPDSDRIMEANANLAGHFCSFKCAKHTFSDERIIAMVRKLRVAVVVYGSCKMVIDAENWGKDDDGDEEKPVKPKKGGSRDDDPDPKGLDRPNSPPPFKLGPGGGF